MHWGTVHGFPSSMKSHSKAPPSGLHTGSKISHGPAASRMICWQSLNSLKESWPPPSPPGSHWETAPNEYATKSPTSGARGSPPGRNSYCGVGRVRGSVWTTISCVVTVTGDSSCCGTIKTVSTVPSLQPLTEAARMSGSVKQGQESGHSRPSGGCRVFAL